MRLASLFLRLPHTLLVTSLALATAALPVQSTELLVLTPDNFKDTTSKGVWFIEYFSPYCRHCRNFAPTWEQLVKDVEAQEDAGVHLAQVNCAVNGDFCRESGVDGYPQLNLYKDGKVVKTFDEVRDPAILHKFLSDHAQPTGTPVAAKVTTPPSPAETPIAYDKLLPPTSDIPINPTGTVLSLNEKTFYDAISHGHIFIKFFAPWCGHCKKLAPLWVELARHMKDKLTIAEVNCEDHGALCRTQDVTGYPMLHYYSGNKKDSKTEYTGGRKIEQLKAFAEKLTGPAVQELKPEDLSKVVNEHPVVYLMLHPVSATKELQLVVDNSKILFGSPPIYVSSATRLFEHFSLDPAKPALLALKDHDSDVPLMVHQFSGSSIVEQKEELRLWLLANRLPTMMELDSDTFQDVMNAPHKPIVLIAASPEGNITETKKSVEDIARKWRANKGATNVVFTWMNSDKWVKWLKSMYGIAGTGVVVADHSRLVYYDVDQYGGKIQLSPTSAHSAVNGVIAGTIPYKHSENMIERFARYVNGKLVSLEQLIARHPWRFVSAVVIVLILVVWFIKRIIWDELDDPYRGRGQDRLTTRKTARLD